METVRIIPCLDVKDGKVVKGINFVSLKNAGDPVECARIYDTEGADELCFLDISASEEGRRAYLEIVTKVAERIFIPFVVGGGIRNVTDMREYLLSGADKVSVNTSAVENPSIIKEGAEVFGSQCIVLAVDAKRVDRKRWKVFIYGGKKETNLDAVDWIKRGVELGAGEILLTSIDADGTQKGYDFDLISQASEAVNVPIIASGGAGDYHHFCEAVEAGASACLAASIFHFGKIKIKELKNYLKKNGVPVRL